MLRTLVRPLAHAGRRIAQNRVALSPVMGGGAIEMETAAEWRRRSLTSPWAASGAVTGSGFHSLTDTRLPKRRPCLAPRRKRASLRPPGDPETPWFSPTFPSHCRSYRGFTRIDSRVFASV